MTTHVLKTHPPYYQAAIDLDKTFEIRRDDRGFQKGDKLLLREYDPKMKKKVRQPVFVSIPTLPPGEYTGRESLFEVTYVTGFEQKEGFVVMGIKFLGTLKAGHE